MKNKLSDLNNHLFAQLERLADEDLTPERLEHEARRGSVMAQVADQIVRGMSLQLQAAKILVEAGRDPTLYLPAVEQPRRLTSADPREAAMLKIVQGGDKT